MAVQSTLVQLVFLWWLLLANWFDRMHRLLYFGPSIKSKIWKTALDCCLFLFDSRLAHFVPTCTKWTISFGDVCSSTTVSPWPKQNRKVVILFPSTMYRSRSIGIAKEKTWRRTVHLFFFLLSSLYFSVADDWHVTWPESTTALLAFVSGRQGAKQLNFHASVGRFAWVISLHGRPYSYLLFFTLPCFIGDFIISLWTLIFLRWIGTLRTDVE